MKTQISASELALLLNIPVKQAVGKINHCLLQPSDEKNPSVSIDVYSKKQNIDLQPYLDDIWNNFFSRHQTKGWVMDYPRERILHGTDKPFPKKISLPRALSSMISPEVKEQNRLAWIERYEPKLPSNVQIEFKP